MAVTSQVSGVLHSALAHAWFLPTSCTHALVLAVAWAHWYPAPQVSCMPGMVHVCAQRPATQDRAGAPAGHAHSGEELHGEPLGLMPQFPPLLLELLELLAWLPLEELPPAAPLEEEEEVVVEVELVLAQPTASRAVAAATANLVIIRMQTSVGDWWSPATAHAPDKDGRS